LFTGEFQLTKRILVILSLCVAILSTLFSSASTATVVRSNGPTVNVLTQHNDNSRTGLNPNETILKPSNVMSTTFGKLFSRNVDGQVYAQPLYASNLLMSDGKVHNVVFVATMHNSIYAFDADDPLASTPIWVLHLGNAVNAQNGVVGSACVNYKDISPEIGILSTPVIDLTSGTLYLIAMSHTGADQNTGYAHTLYALDITSGINKQTPTIITASVPGGPSAAGRDGSGNLVFDSKRSNQRPSLLLAKNALNQTYVYAAFASFCDTGPYHGWLLGYNTADITQPPLIYNDTTNGYNGGIWQANQGLTADSSGNIYMQSGNGAFDTGTGTPTDLGDSVMKLTNSGSAITIANTGSGPTFKHGWFTPYNQGPLDSADLDFGSSGILLLPGSNYAVASSKEGKMYVLNNTDLGGFSGGSADTNVKQWLYGSDAEITTTTKCNFIAGASGTPGDDTSSCWHIHGSPAYWDGGAAGKFIYVGAENSHLRAYAYNPSNPLPLQASAAMTSTYIGPNPVTNNPYNGNKPDTCNYNGNCMPGSFVSVSSNLTDPTSGLVWALVVKTGDANQGLRPAILHVLNAATLGDDLWNSEMVPTRDSIDICNSSYAGCISNPTQSYAKFSNVTVANGKVYVPTFNGQVIVYGLLTLAANNTTYDFAAPQNASIPASQGVTLTTPTTSVITWTATINYGSGSGWLNLSQTNGTVSAGSPFYPQLNVNTTNLTPGIYTATVTYFSAANLAPTFITYTVVSSSGLHLVSSNDNLSFNTQFGQNPTTQGLSLNATLNPVSWNASINYGSARNRNWLKLDQTSGVASSGVNSPINLSVDVTGLAPGTYQAAVAFKDTANSADVATTNVTLLIAPAAITKPAYTYYVPVLANDGQNISSAVTVQNIGNAPTQVQITFYQRGSIKAPRTDLTTCAQVAVQAQCNLPNLISHGGTGASIIYANQPLNILVTEYTPYGGSAYSLAAGASNKLIVPLAINQAMNFNTVLSIFNGGANASPVTVDFYDQSGNKLIAASKQLNLAAYNSLDLDQSAEDSQLPSGYYGWVEISAPTGSLLAAQVMESNPFSQFLAIVNAQAGPHTKMLAPAVFNHTFGGFVTGANIVNPNDYAVQVTINYYNMWGKNYTAAPFTLNAHAVQPIYHAANQGNGLPVDGLPDGFYGAAEVESSGAGVVMLVNQAANTLDGGIARSGSYSALASGSSVLNLPVVAYSAGGGQTTGTTIYNSSDAPVTISMQYYTSKGAVQGKVQDFTIAAHASLPLYQGLANLPLDFLGTASITQTSGADNSLVATVNAESLNLFYSYTAPV
jgi:hypothetical protein